MDTAQETTRLRQKALARAIDLLLLNDYTEEALMLSEALNELF